MKKPFLKKRKPHQIKKKTTTSPESPSTDKKSTFSKPKSQTKSTSKKATKSKFSKNPRLLGLNAHINFEREGEKNNSRKWATDVICCQCRQKFTLAFKPRNPEVYCDECFKKRRSRK